ncbi:MAG: exosortase system-associated protein, TIGR04073 family [Candidatus Omnitrophota bacterium]|nr:exosortase system-associated protein, TIGR04073 family [Candidatus Omnitrophota bacterium]
MKKIVVCLTAICIMASSSVLYARDNPATKLGRGAANIVTCGFEIPKGFMDQYEKSGIFAGLSAGVCVGIFKAIRRALVGVYEVGTFFVPIPEYYESLLKDPEYFLTGA